jgi:malonate transporter
LPADFRGGGFWFRRGEAQMDAAHGHGGDWAFQLQRRAAGHAVQVDAIYFAGYLGACLSIFAVVMLIGRMARGNIRIGSAFGAAAAMGNVGYLAPPLMLPMLGPRIAGPVAMAIVAEVAVIIALGSMLMAPSAKGEGLKAVMAGLRGLLRNPVILSIALGAASAGLELPIPAPIERFLSFLGNAAGPTALFALGGTLARLKIGGQLFAVAFGITAAKLLIYPALVWFVLGSWLALDPFWVICGVLLAAMPTATNAYLLAQRQGVGAEEASAAVLFTTIIASIAFPATAWLLDVPVP